MNVDEYWDELWVAHIRQLEEERKKWKLIAIVAIVLLIAVALS